MHAAQLGAASTPFIMGGFEAAPLRSRNMLIIHFSMLHVLTDVRSRRAHRLSSFLFNSSNEHNQTLLNAALHRTRAVAAARDGGRSALAMDLAARAHSLVHRGDHMVPDGRLGARVVLHAGHDSRLPACAKRTECLRHGYGDWGHRTAA